MDSLIFVTMPYIDYCSTGSRLVASPEETIEIVAGIFFNSYSYTNANVLEADISLYSGQQSGDQARMDNRCAICSTIIRRFTACILKYSGVRLHVLCKH